MYIHLRRAVVIVLLLTAAACLSITLPLRASAEESGEIEVIKQWSEGAEKPDSVTLRLLRSGQAVGVLTLTGADEDSGGTWHGSFKNIPIYDNNGTPIVYTVEELPVDGFVSRVSRQPESAGISVGDWGKKVTPASSSAYEIGSANLLVAKKGGNYYVWTNDKLGDGEKSRLLSAINSAKLQGLGKSLGTGNTEFASGLPVSFSDGVSLRQKDGGTVIAFPRTSAWSLFYAGTLTRTAAKSAVVFNAQVVSPTSEPTAAPTSIPTAEPSGIPTSIPSADPTSAPSSAPTVVPTVAPTVIPSAVPTAVPTVIPTAAPSPIPKTADESDIIIMLVMFFAAMAGSVCITEKLRRDE